VVCRANATHSPPHRLGSSWLIPLRVLSSNRSHSNLNIWPVGTLCGHRVNLRQQGRRRVVTIDTLTHHASIGEACLPYQLCRQGPCACSTGLSHLSLRNAMHWPTQGLFSCAKCSTMGAVSLLSGVGVLQVLQ
jgi:hypothetical protein